MVGIRTGIGIGGVGRQEALLKQIPAVNLANVWLDGTIIDISGSKYFVDKKSGSKVLISGYDFPAGWTKGFPYKSAATIDIFGLTAVPVISLFQNINYENQYFSRHIVQTIDVNGIEVTPAYVAEIVAYAAPLTGTDLTAANTYFNPPTEATTAVRWVTKSGLDTNPAGTKIAPWLTETKAVASSTSGDKVYTKSGLFLEATYLNISTDISQYALGQNILRGTDARWIIRKADKNTTWNNWFIDGNGAVSSCIQIVNAGTQSDIFNRCKIKGATQYLFVGAVSETAIFKDCILIGAVGVVSQELYGYISLVDSSFIDNCEVKSLKDYTIKNNRWYSNAKVNCVSSVNVNAVVLGNNFAYNKSGVASPTNATTKTFAIKNNTFNQGNTANIISVAIDLSQGASAEIKNNKFVNLTETLASGSGEVFIQIQPNTTVPPDIQNNIFKSVTKSTVKHIRLLSTAAVGSAKIKNNYIKSNSTPGGSIVTLNEELGSINIWDDSEIIGNRIVAYKSDYPNEVGTGIHALLVNDGINMLLCYNHISHSMWSMVIKTGNQGTYTSGGVYGNLIREGVHSIWISGISGINIFNNTIIHSGISYGVDFYSGIKCVENTSVAGDQWSENVIIKNNIIISERVAGHLIDFDAHSAANGSVSDYNLFYSANPKPFIIGTTEYAFAEWQALGFDAHSIMLPSIASAKALFTDYDNADFSLAVGSRAIGFGALFAGYTTGLDASTTWGSDITTPAIVTKENATNCVGAYVV